MRLTLTGPIVVEIKLRNFSNKLPNLPGLRLGVVRYFNTLQPCLPLVAGVVVLTKLACNSSIMHCGNLCVNVCLVCLCQLLTTAFLSNSGKNVIPSSIFDLVFSSFRTLFQILVFRWISLVFDATGAT